MEAAFTEVYRNPKYPGLTGEYENPRKQASSYAAMLTMQGRAYTVTCHADGAYTVDSAGVEPITFAPLPLAKRVKDCEACGGSGRVLTAKSE